MVIDNPVAIVEDLSSPSKPMIADEVNQPTVVEESPLLSNLG